MKRRYFLFLFLFLFLLSACDSYPEDTTEAEIQFFNTNGKEKAYLFTHDGKMITNSDPTHIEYFIASLPYKYKTAMTKAASAYRANEIQAYVNIETNTIDSSLTYKAELITPPPPAPPGSCDNPLGCDTVVINIMTIDGTDAIALNYPIFHPNDNSKIIGSTIYFDDMIMIEYLQSEKNYIAIHELGHTLGLKDLEDSEDLSFQGKTVMYAKGAYRVEELYKFDIANILWHYKYGYVG
jgi:hypothetical protein